jgi:uncharacterized protein
MRVGLISDTHGLLRPEALAFLQGCDHIVHGGDIGAARILDTLAAIAPLTAVRGNNDGAAWADGVPETALCELAGVRLYAIHDLARLGIDPVAERIQVVVSGHSHRPLAEKRGGVLYLNPGSAGPRRFRLPISAAELVIETGAALHPRIVQLV